MEIYNARYKTNSDHIPYILARSYCKHYVFNNNFPVRNPMDNSNFAVIDHLTATHIFYKSDNISQCSAIEICKARYNTNK